MSSLESIRQSNSLISSSLAPGLVAIFAGGTSGIGEATLKQLAKHAIRPRVYIIGRNQDAANRIMAECQAINPEMQLSFLRADLSLLRNVDRVCDEVRTKENVIDLMFLSAGTPDMSRSVTSEGLHTLTATSYYSRVRMALLLHPLLHRSQTLARVIMLNGGTGEGRLDPSDYPGLRISIRKLRGHLITLSTLTLEALSARAPGVTFINADPGFVRTPNQDSMTGVLGVIIRFVAWIAGRWICVPLEESGERNLFVATSGMFGPRHEGAGGRVVASVELVDGLEVARGTDGRIGTGVYSVGWDMRTSSPEREELLASYRAEGVVEKVWGYTQGEFDRVAALKHREDRLSSGA